MWFQLSYLVLLSRAECKERMKSFDKLVSRSHVVDIITISQNDLVIIQFSIYHEIRGYHRALKKFLFHQNLYSHTQYSIICHVILQSPTLNPGLSEMCPEQPDSGVPHQAPNWYMSCLHSTVSSKPLIDILICNCILGK